MLPDLFQLAIQIGNGFIQARDASTCAALASRRSAHNSAPESTGSKIARDRRRCLLSGTEIFHVFWCLARALAFVSGPVEFCEVAMLPSVVATYSTRNYDISCYRTDTQYTPRVIIGVPLPELPQAPPPGWQRRSADRSPGDRHRSARPPASTRDRDAGAAQSAKRSSAGF